MKRLLALLSLFIVSQATYAKEIPSLFDDVTAITKELSEITGWKLKRPVPNDTMTREALKKYIQQKIKEQVKPEEIRLEELALKKFGFLPQEFNLERATVDLLTEQAAAFYDYHKQRLYVLDSNSDSMQQMALVHELAHALADQHFRLDKFIKKSDSGDDSAVARMAVMEGQASWLTFEYLSRKAGRNLKDSPDFLKAMVMAMNSGGEQFPVLEKAPVYMREGLLFPYTQGTLFQQRVVEKMDKAAFSEVFRNPPASSQQILHPDKYFAHENPSHPKPLPCPERKGYRKVYEGSFGELDHSILLQQYAGKQAAGLAAQWKGSSFVIVERRSEARSMLSYVSEWQTDDAAREFFGHYRSVLKGKWKRLDVSTDTPSELTGTGDDGHFVLKLDGARVTSLEGIPNLKP